MSRRTFYPKVEGAGRPPIGLARKLRMYVAQQCFGLSDERIEETIYMRGRNRIALRLIEEWSTDTPRSSMISSRSR
jgi:hypothetical protein